jgi:tetrahydromethanopterin S-methyltransferase subunit G
MTADSENRVLEKLRTGRADAADLKRRLERVERRLELTEG